jgi:hypothetical protein
MNDDYQIICENVVTARHNDQTMLRRLLDASARRGIAQEFIPVPANLSAAEEQREWRLSRWGILQDFGEKGPTAVTVPLDSPAELHFDMEEETPCKVYGELMRLGFDLDVLFLEYHYTNQCTEESKTAYCGRITNSGRTQFKVLCRAPECLRRFINDEVLRAFHDFDYVYDDQDEEEVWWDCYCASDRTSWAWPIWPDTISSREEAEKADQRAKQTNCSNDREIAREMWFRMPEAPELILEAIARLRGVAGGGEAATYDDD